MRWLLSVAVVVFTIQFGIGCAPTGSVSGGMAEVSRPPGQLLPDATSHTEIKTISDSSSSVTEDSIDALKKAILILPLRDKSKYNGPWDIYGQLANGLADSLKRFDAYRIIQPETVFNHLDRKERVGKLKSSRAVDLGREIGADVVAVGEIIDISMKRFRATVPLGGYRSYQGLTQIKLFFYNVIDGQAAGECECEALINSKRTGVVNPAAHVPLEKEYFFLAEVEWGTQEFHETLVGQSVGECLHQLSAAVENVVRPVPELTVSEPKIIDVDGVQAYINVGSADGVKNGDKFGVWDLGRELRDPETDAVLGHAVSRRVGVIQVDQILNDHLSQVKVLEGEGEIQPTFTIRSE